MIVTFVSISSFFSFHFFEVHLTNRALTRRSVGLITFAFHGTLIGCLSNGCFNRFHLHVAYGALAVFCIGLFTFTFHWALVVHCSSFFFCFAFLFCYLRICGTETENGNCH